MPTALKATPVITCEGGLDATQLVHTTKPGTGVTLVNYEPDQEGGYRRISGFTKFNTNALSGTGAVLGVCVFNSGVLAFRQNDLYFATSGSGAWSSSIDTRAGTISKVRFERYNWNGTDKVVYVDGVNDASTYDGTTVVDLTGGPTNAKYVAEFKRHLFFSGYSTNPAAITYTAPLDETEFDPALGAGELGIGDTVVGLKSFRERLFIFCENSIHVLEGSSEADFIVKPVTKNIGCIAPDSIQEISGDILFLAPDGIRTIAGTERFDDIELGALTRNIQSIVSSLYNFSNICSVLVKRKSQYRLFYNAPSGDEANASGILGGITHSVRDTIGWEWFELYGFKPYICDNGYIGNIEYAVHGGYDGYVYYQDVGTNLNGSNIRAHYRTPAIDFGDATERKVLHKVNVYHKIEGANEITMRLYYDREASGVSQPPAYVYSLVGGGAIYGSGTYGSSLYSVISVPFERRAVHGSGFLVQLDFVSDDTDASYTIEGFSFEFKQVGKR